MSDNIRIIDLENEIFASLLSSVLEERDIPHIIRTYHDSAYDGLFAYQQGWGFVEAPEEYREEILAIYEELQQGQQPAD